MTDNRLWQNPWDDRWYFWDESWLVCHGPLNEYVEAHAAMSKQIEEQRGKENNQVPNCS